MATKPVGKRQTYKPPKPPRKPKLNIGREPVRGNYPGTYKAAAPKPPAKAPTLPITGRAIGQGSVGGGSTIDQLVQQIIGPQIAFYNQQRSDLTARQTAQQQALRGFTTSLLGYLQGIPASVDATYGKAVTDTSALGNAAAQGLINANPNGAAVATLNAIGAPQAQVDAITQQNADVFGGGGAVLNYVGGALPAETLAADRAANVAFAQELPGIQSMTAAQAFRQLLGSQSQQQSAIDETLAKIRSDAQGQAYGIQSDLAQQALSAQKFAAQRADAAFNRKYKIAGLDQRGAIAADSSKYKWATLGSREQLAQLALRDKQAARALSRADKLANTQRIQGNADRTYQIALAKLQKGVSAKPLTPAQRSKAWTFVQRAQSGFYASQADPWTPLSSKQIGAAAKAAKMTVNDFLSNTKEGAAARAGAGIGVHQIGQHNDKDVQNLYLTLTRQYQVPARQAFDMIAKLYPQWAGARKKTYFPNGGAGAPPFGGSGFPLGGRRPASLIGRPYQGTHTLYGNWESDNAIDIPAPARTPVYAVADGVIGSQLGSLGKGGNLSGDRVHLVTNGNEFYYAHLLSYTVRPGQRVKKGQLIGYTGALNHLHIASKHGDPQRIFGYA